jgi:predicted ribosome quality control (RQC) complex YloA/Tae2 family protein
LIIARDEGEGRFLSGYRKSYATLHPVSHAGALVLIDGQANEEDIYLSAQIAARYSQGRNAKQVTIMYESCNGTQELQVTPLLDKSTIDQWLI